MHADRIPSGATTIDLRSSRIETRKSLGAVLEVEIELRRRLCEANQELIAALIDRLPTDNRGHNGHGRRSLGCGVERTFRSGSAQPGV